VVTYGIDSSQIRVILAFIVLFGLGDVKGALNLILFLSIYGHDMIVTIFLNDRILQDEDELEYCELVLIIMCLYDLLSIIHFKSYIIVLYLSG